MIVAMKRLTLICLSSQREDALRKLQDMSVVHINNLRPPDSRALETSRNHLAYINRVLETMSPKSAVPPSGVPADVIVSLVWTMLQEQKDIEDELDDLRQERMRVEPFGDFDPGMIMALRERGVFVKLYAASINLELKAPEGATLVEINRDKTTAWLALFAREDTGLPVPEFRLPDRSLKDINEQIVEYESRLKDCVESLARHAGDYGVVAKLRDQLEDTVHFLEVRDGMGSAAPVAYLRGFIPAEKSALVLEAARREGWGVMIDDPAPEDETPTQIRNPRWVRPVESVLKAINVLPGYAEVDMSVIFLFFFSLFFAILIGDAGYGLIFLVGTRLARRKFRAAPPEPFALLTLTSVCTIGWGMITGSYFGAATLPPVLEGLKIPWLLKQENFMSMCFMIGAVHLTIAHLWNIIRMFPGPLFLAQAGWIGMTWTMYFVAHMLVLGQPMPAWVPWMAIAGAALILLFMTPPSKLKEEWFNHVMFPLNVVSNFVDVVSYIRLFAVGFASLAVAQSFNSMALAGGISGPVSGLIAALILFFGHALNVVLGAMGVLVHGVRLNTLEFSSHLGVQWSGHAYAPFARKYKSTENA